MVRSATFSARPDAAALQAQASRETGLRDFGAGQFRGPLETLVAFLDAADGLGADDRRAAFGQVVRVLGWRLRPDTWGSWPDGTIWHTGFTGTSLLIAPPLGVAVPSVIVVLLKNELTGLGA